MTVPNAPPAKNAEGFTVYEEIMMARTTARRLLVQLERIEAMLAAQENRK